MNRKYHEVSLDTLIQRRKEEIEIDDFTVYKRLTIHMNGQGISVRDQEMGSSIGTKHQFVVKGGQFVLSKIDARNGAFGIVPVEGDGSIITGNFWAFDIDYECLDIKFFNYLTKTPLFIDFCMRASDGTTNRRYLQEDKFLSQRIMLPPIEEQHRIVARIEELAAKIEEARGLRREAVEAANRLLSTTISQNLTEIKSQSKKVTLASVANSITDGDHQPPPKADSGIPFILISHITSGKLDLTDCRWVPEEYYSSISASRIPKRGDILYTAVGATYGTPCLVDTDKAFCFQRHIAIIKPDRNQINSEYLRWVLSSSDVYNQATHFVTGSAQPTVPLRGIRQLMFPLPSLEQQNVLANHFNVLQAQVNLLKHHQSQTTAELNALLSSILDKASKGEL